MSYAESPSGASDKKKLLGKAKKCFKQACDAWAKQRERDRKAIRFQMAENQWPEDAKKERKGRPMLSISLLRQPMALVKNQAANAKLGLNLSPVNEDATEELAEVKQGLYRRIERDGKANPARMWALAHALHTGLGFYRINTQWDEDSNDPSDQEIIFERILFQDSVYMDPSAQEADFSDAGWAHIVARVAPDDFRREWPDAEMASEGFDFDGLGVTDPGWVDFGGEEAAPIVSEYFYKVYKAERVKIGKGNSRMRNTVTLRRAVCTATEVLEDEEWNHNLIPIIPVIWEELQPIDGERIWEGMVGPAEHGQMAFNYAISSVVEDVSRVSKAPYVGAAGAFAGFEKQWKEANIRNQPYLEYNTIDVMQKPIQPPVPMQIDGTKMALSSQLAEMAKGLVQAATSIYDPSLGKGTGDPKESGRKVLALQQQGLDGTSNGVENLVTITLPYEARVVLGLMPPIYDRPGRVTSVLGVEDKAKMIMLNAPYVMNDKGRPVAAQQGQQGVKEHRLADGKYSIAPSAGKSFQTRLEQGATEMGEILAGAPELMPVIGDLYFKFRDFPGAKEISERLAKWREKQIPGLGDDKEGPSPEQAKAAMEGMQQQLQMLQQQLQEAGKIIETEQVKQQAQVQTEQLKTTAQVEIARMNNATKVLVARISAARATASEAKQSEEEAMALALDHAHEKDMREFDAAHDVGMAAGGGMTTTMKREGGQETGQEQTDETGNEQSSASAPPEAEA